MANENSVTFPGFILKSKKDTWTHEVEIGEVNSGGVRFVLEMIRNKQYPDLPFVIAKIHNTTSTLLWDFKNEGFDGVGLLAQACNEVVVALVGRGKTGKVERIIPLSKLVSTQPVDLQRAIWLKADAAKFLGRELIFSLAENIILKAEIARKEVEQEAARITAAEARAAARQELISTILKRGKLEVFTADGRRRFGLPVLEGEWTSLHDRTFVVLIDSVGEDGKIGNVIEAFQIIKERGRNPQKGSPAPVTVARPTLAQAKPGVKKAGVTVVETEDGAFEVQLYETMDDIRQARMAGLNGGTLAAVRGKPKAKITVFSVRHDGIETVGEFVPLT
jgi:hypothetical protein